MIHTSFNLEDPKNGMQSTFAWTYEDLKGRTLEKKWFGPYRVLKSHFNGFDKLQYFVETICFTRYNNYHLKPYVT